MMTVEKDVIGSCWKLVLLQGIPPNANLEDIERFLAGCEYDPSNIRQFSRSMLNCLKLTRPPLGFLILLMISGGARKCLYGGHRARG
ncbi:hypothetical protein CTI12_AA161810 [Artemisia annua]|uniref:Uncharacterized protein n=1 Tax=Artemisia annua TaxID=35608 RepID=A0A2U1PDM9_ARTAN|nr:hypothetical protein CTI12_AA161810 [Artemisia annua]